jgi:putative ABC transport system permease protein
MLINEAFARQYFRGEDPLGKKLQLGWGGDEPKEIVGVVGNVRHRGLDDQPRPEMYVPQAQFKTNDMTLLVRANTKPESLTQLITAEVRKLDPQLPLTDVKTLDQYRSDTVAMPRFNLLVLTLFAGLALALTVIGLYGVISYSVTQRTSEIGVRMALGAQPLDILRMILQQGMGLVFIGVAIGLAGAWAVTRVMSSLLFEVSTSDPLTFFSVALLLTVVALLASFLPAYRATKVDPVIALRYE